MERKSSPTQFYSLALCVHILAYVLSLIAAFTPKWSSVTETSVSGTITLSYDRGPIVSCDSSSGCGFNKDISGSSSLFFACFLIVIGYIVFGFFALQLLINGLCVRSLRERNLGIPLIFHFVVLMLLVVLAIVLFEASVTKDVTDGSDYEEHTFGISRYALLGAAVLYFICTFFALGEYLKRKSYNSVQQTNTAVVAMDSIPHTPSSKPRSNNNGSNYNKSSASDVAPKDAKFSKRDSKAPPYSNYDDFGFTPNQNKKATTSIIPLEGHTYFR